MTWDSGSTIHCMHTAWRWDQTSLLEQLHFTYDSRRIKMWIFRVFPLVESCWASKSSQFWSISDSTCSDEKCPSCMPRTIWFLHIHKTGTAAMWSCQWMKRKNQAPWTPTVLQGTGEACVLDRNMHIGSHTHRPDKGTLSKASNSHFSVPRTCWCGLRERLPFFVQEFCVQQAWSSCGWHLNPDKKEERKPQVSCGDSQLCNCFQPRCWVLAFAFCGSPGSRFVKPGLYSHLSFDTHGTQPGVRLHMWGRLQCFLQWMGTLCQVSWEIRNSRYSI